MSESRKSIAQIEKTDIDKYYEIIKFSDGTYMILNEEKPSTHGRMDADTLIRVLSSYLHGAYHKIRTLQSNGSNG